MFASECSLCQLRLAAPTASTSTSIQPGSKKAVTYKLIVFLKKSMTFVESTARTWLCTEISKQKSTHSGKKLPRRVAAASRQRALGALEPLHVLSTAAFTLWAGRR
jgi:hypothetical protein